MPELYGNEFKHKIRAERNSLRRELRDEKVEHSKTRSNLRYARAKIDELESKIERMKQLLQNAITEADQDIGPTTFKRFKDSYRFDLTPSTQN